MHAGAVVRDARSLFESASVASACRHVRMPGHFQRAVECHGAVALDQVGAQLVLLLRRCSRGAPSARAGLAPKRSGGT
jgi:hypothetical protein